jgi:uncharacterized protein YggU (UPF0235/DUF167 family)
VETEESKKGSILDLRVFPNARKQCVEFLGDSIKIWVKATPHKGCANREVEAVFSRLDPDARIIRGFSSRRKKIFLPNIDSETVHGKLNKLLE